MARFTSPLLVALSAVVLANHPANAGGSSDLNGDGHVDILDLQLLVAQWGPVACGTTVVGLAGNINVSGAVTPTGSLHEARAFHTDAAMTPGLEMTGAEDLSLPSSGGGTDLYVGDASGGSLLALEGGADAIVTVNGVTKGGHDLGEASFAFSIAPAVLGTTDDHGTTMSDFLDFLDLFLGLDRPIPPPADPNHWLGAATSINAYGQLVIWGNEGAVQDLDMHAIDFTVTYADSPVGSPISHPFLWTRMGTATGESASVELAILDSLCVSLDVVVSVVLQAPTPFGPTAIWIAESGDNADLDRLLGLGTISFDKFGQYWMVSNTAFNVIRDNGAVSPLTANVDFDSPLGAITTLGNAPSSLLALPITGADAADFDGDGVVGIVDFLALLANWGPCP